MMSPISIIFNEAEHVFHICFRCGGEEALGHSMNVVEIGFEKIRSDAATFWQWLKAVPWNSALGGYVCVCVCVLTVPC